jgi:hypothetical protein
MRELAAEFLCVGEESEREKVLFPDHQVQMMYSH